MTATVRWQSLRACWRPWLVTHIGIWGLAAIVGAIVDTRPAARLDSSVPELWRLLGSWDASWYMDIAAHGYSTEPSGAKGYTNVAFFPLFPGLIRGVMAFGLSPFWATMLVSTIASLFALTALHTVTTRVAGTPPAHRVVWVAALFPPAVTLGLGYSEGLALALAAAAAALALRGAWLWAGVVAAAATLNRPTGVLVVALVALLALQAAPTWRDRLPKLAAAAIPAAVALIGYAVLMQQQVGSWRASMDAQRAWNRGSGTPFVFDFQQPTRVDELIRDLLFGSLAVALVIVLLRRQPGGHWRPWGIYSAACLAMPLATGSVYSLARFTLVAFPILWPLTDLVCATPRRRRVATVAAVLLGAALVAQLAWHSP